MPNRGPVSLSETERDALLSELPPKADLKDAEDAEERARMTCANAVLERLAEMRFSDGADATVVLSTDELDSILDNLGPPSAKLKAVQQKCGEHRRHLLEHAKDACNCGKD